MSFQIRSLMIRLAPEELEKRAGMFEPLSDQCVPVTTCCDCQTSGGGQGGRAEPCEALSQHEPTPHKHGDSEQDNEENPAGAASNENLKELSLLQQQLRQTLNQQAV